MSKLIPENGRVVVKRKDAESVSRGGIVIPETSQKKQQIGVVVATNDHINKDGDLVPSNYTVGDTVIFPLYSGEEFILPDGEKVLLIQEDSILGRIVD